MPLKLEVLQAWPPGGWQYKQGATGWDAPSPLAYTFEQQVKNIIKHRQANPRFKLSLNYDEVARELDTYTCRRLQNNPKFCLFPTDIKKKPHLTPTTRPSGASFVGAVRSAAGLMAEWLGQGLQPVSHEQASTRAQACTSGELIDGQPHPCSANSRGVQRLVTSPIAQTIRAVAGLKNRLKLSTLQDSRLYSCSVCLCDLKLKVWIPFATIEQETPPEVWEALPAHCWMLKERALVNSPNQGLT